MSDSTEQWKKGQSLREDYHYEACNSSQCPCYLRALAQVTESEATLTEARRLAQEAQNHLGGLQLKDAAEAAVFGHYIGKLIGLLAGPRQP